jgi:hypothetical protein
MDDDEDDKEDDNVPDQYDDDLGREGAWGNVMGEPAGL